VILILMFVLAPILTGAMLIRNNYASKKKKELELRKSSIAAREKEILKLAKKKDGMLTIPEIVAETSMDAEQADEIMREFVIKQYVDMKITKDGSVIYEFFEFAREEDDDPKRHRRSFTDDREIQ
jgi:hypothetical protein